MESLRGMATGQSIQVEIKNHGLVDSIVVTMPDGRKILTTTKPGVKKTDRVVKNLIRQYNYEPKQ